ncbi:MAG: DUF3039 domain-containing protein, partial [Actinomycetales bacterium]|nr:DUF3039 domain-containing protein [Actinomycetales bacterium]
MGLFTRRSGTDGLSDTALDERIQEDLESGDHERFAHYVKKEKIVESAVTGKAVTALCGKRWIPNRDPKNFPICPTCKEIYAGLRKEPT